MESLIKIRANLKDMEGFFESNNVCSVRHYEIITRNPDLNDEDRVYTFKANVRHLELDEHLKGTFTIPKLKAALQPHIEKWEKQYNVQLGENLEVISLDSDKKIRKETVMDENKIKNDLLAEAVDFCSRMKNIHEIDESMLTAWVEHAFSQAEVAVESGVSQEEARETALNEFAEAFETIERNHSGTAAIIFNHGVGYVPHELHGAAEFIANGGSPAESLEMASNGAFEGSVEKSVYYGDIPYARENNEIELYKKSKQLNEECAKAIDKAIIDVQKNTGMTGAYTYDMEAALDEVSKKYGFERVTAVIAHAVNRYDWDGRLSNDNKMWAKTIELPKVDYIELKTHLATLDGFTNAVRRENQTAALLRDVKASIEILRESDKTVNSYFSELNEARKSVFVSHIVQVTNDECPYYIGDYEDTEEFIDQMNIYVEDLIKDTVNQEIEKQKPTIDTLKNLIDGKLGENTYICVYNKYGDFLCEGKPADLRTDGHWVLMDEESAKVYKIENGTSENGKNAVILHLSNFPLKDRDIQTTVSKTAESAPLEVLKDIQTRIVDIDNDKAKKPSFLDTLTQSELDEKLCDYLDLTKPQLEEWKIENEYEYGLCTEGLGLGEYIQTVGELRDIISDREYELKNPDSDIEDYFDEYIANAKTLPLQWDYEEIADYVISRDKENRESQQAQEPPLPTAELPEPCEDVDKFYLHDNGRVEMLYYNPNGYDEQGQYVSDNYSYQEIIEAANQAEGSVEKFYKYLNDNARQYLIDNDGGAEFISTHEQYCGDSYNFEGSTLETMNDLVNYAKTREWVESNRIDVDSVGVVIEGQEGTWRVAESHYDEDWQRSVYLLEHEENGSEIIVDSEKNLIGDVHFHWLEDYETYKAQAAARIDEWLNHEPIVSGAAQSINQIEITEENTMEQNQNNSPKITAQVTPVEIGTKLRGSASVVVSGVAVHGVNVVEGDKGLFVSMPSKQATNGKYYDIAYPQDKKTLDNITEVVLAAYADALKNGRQDKSDPSLDPANIKVSNFRPNPYENSIKGSCNVTVDGLVITGVKVVETKKDNVLSVVLPSKPDANGGYIPIVSATSPEFYAQIKEKVLDYYHNPPQTLGNTSYGKLADKKAGEEITHKTYHSGFAEKVGKQLDEDGVKWSAKLEFNNQTTIAVNKNDLPKLEAAVEKAKPPQEIKPTQPAADIPEPPAKKTSGRKS